MLIGIGKNDAFGIDENTLKTRDEKRLADIARNREDQVQSYAHLKQVTRKEEVLDAKAENAALETVGGGRALEAPGVDAAAPSGEASGLKAQELRA